MSPDALNSLVGAVATAAKRGRRKDGQQYWTVGTTGVSVTHAYSHALKQRAVLVCAVGPMSKENEIVGYRDFPTDQQLHVRIDEVVRTLVGKVEGYTPVAGRMLS